MRIPIVIIMFSIWKIQNVKFEFIWNSEGISKYSPNPSLAKFQSTIFLLPSSSWKREHKFYFFSLANRYQPPDSHVVSISLPHCHTQFYLTMWPASFHLSPPSPPCCQPPALSSLTSLPPPWHLSVSHTHTHILILAPPIVAYNQHRATLSSTYQHHHNHHQPQPFFHFLVSLVRCFRVLFLSCLKF